MRIETVQPPPPPKEIALTFPVSEGWALVAALYEYAERNPAAANAEIWRGWSKALDKELRRG